MGIKGNIFNIQRFSVQDGEGVRTLVFLKGCPLRCQWCCNPESQALSPVLLYQKTRCIHCQLCVAACPQGAIRAGARAQEIDRGACLACGACARACCAGALEMSGEVRTLEDVYEEINKDRLLFENSGGGVTLSGGEPFVQHEFALALLKKCKQNGIHTAVETCGSVPWASIEEALAFVDLFLFDIKQMDSAIHERFVGVGNAQILENLRAVARFGKRVIVRLPIIPGVNDTLTHARDTIAFMRENGLREANLLPFHKFGLNKYESLGQTYAFRDAPSIAEDLLEQMRNAFEAAGIRIRLFAH